MLRMSPKHEQHVPNRALVPVHSLLLLAAGRARRAHQARVYLPTYRLPPPSGEIVTTALGRDQLHQHPH